MLYKTTPNIKEKSHKEELFCSGKFLIIKFEVSAKFQRNFHVKKIQSK